MNRFAFFLSFTVLCSAAGAETTRRGVTDTSPSPHAVMSGVALDEVKWTDGFWARRFETCRTQMVPGMWRLMSGTNHSQYFENFRIAAGLVAGRSRGAPFNDGDFYKWMEAATAVYAVTREAELDRTLDEVITVIAQAQRADGYLHTPTLIRQRNGEAGPGPFQNPLNFEMYNLGHLMTTACLHFRVTGKTNLLAVACRAADFIGQAFREPTPELAKNSICPAHYLGIVELYRTTREPRYLELAKKFFAVRELVRDGGDDNQDRIPFLQQTNALGHAVRANYLYAGAAGLFAETGDPALWQTVSRLWTNVVTQKMYLTGGCGALYDGASPDGSKDQKSITRTHQAYGRDYQLPNLTAHNETCANIGNVLWNWRMLQVTGEARYADVAELALYNSVLSGASLDGTNFFYTNPLRVSDPMPVPLRWSRSRVPYVSSFCCPPNLARIVAEAGGMAYSVSSDAVWVQLYGANTLRTRLPGGPSVKLRQETDYPWNGKIRLVIEEASGGPFALRCRIPGWTRQAGLELNGAPLPAPAPGAYAEIRREWKAGDRLDLELNMPVTVLEANPAVEETRNQIALKRGPVVYCVESADLPKGTRLNDVLVNFNADFIARYDRNFLGGVAFLQGTGWARPAGNWENTLYREARPARLQPFKLRLVPYFAWNNRGAGEMSVWLPTTPAP